MGVELGEEHAWLAKLVGEWTWTSEMPAAPGEPPGEHRGTETMRSLAGVWVVGEGRAEAPDGQSATNIMTLGYDPARGRFVGTFIASMMTHLWVYEGELDAAGRVLTLATEGPSFTTEGKMARYQDRIELLGDDHRTLSSSFLGDDGTWHPFMTAHYRRKR